LKFAKFIGENKTMILTCRLIDLDDYLMLVVSPFGAFFVQIKGVSEFSDLQIG